ncbi:hypothetical protein A2U01_0096846, partial [Trifolium medium]|nr:hypothetical protein [Trifolium medium]
MWRFVGICLNLDYAGSVDGAARSGLGATRCRVLVKSGLCLSMARRADELGAARARAV